MAEKEYIEREVLMNYPIRRDNYDKKNGNENFINGVESVLEYAESLPTADVVPVVHGHWVYNPNGMDFVLGAWECSICGIKNDNLPYDRKINPYNYIGSKYCSNCGSKMDGKENNDNE